MWLHAGAWPLPTTDAAQDALSKMRDAVRNALQAWQGVESTYFSVNYTFNGSDPVPLPGIFMTPDASKRLPLVIQGTGFDYFAICICQMHLGYSKVRTSKVLSILSSLAI